MWSGFKSWRRRHLWVEFVAGSLLGSERFFSGYSGFPLSLKTNTSKFHFDLERPDTFQLPRALWVSKLQIKKNYLISHIHLAVEEANNSLSWGQPSDAKCTSFFTDFIGLLSAKIY